MLLSFLKSSKIPCLGVLLAVLCSLLLPPKASASSRFTSPQPPAKVARIQLKSSQPQPSTTIKAQGTTAQRSLEVRAIRGTATFQGRPVKIGDRLSATGDEIITGNQSQVRLGIDNNLGTIEVLENTIIQLEILSTAADGTPVTAVSVPKGRVRLSIRHSAGKPPVSQALKKLDETRIATVANLTEINPISVLAQNSNSAKNAPVRVRTPRGVAGVRGTSFGVSVSPNGKTAVDTIEGTVAVAGAQQEVLVNAGYWVILDDREPTSVKVNPPLSELQIKSLFRLSYNTFRLVAQVAPTDLIYINDRPIQTDLEGQFKIEGSLPLSRRLKIVLRGPSVRERVYQLVVP